MKKLTYYQTFVSNIDEQQSRADEGVFLNTIPQISLRFFHRLLKDTDKA